MSEEKKDRPKSKYQKRKRARMNGKPIAARAIQPWWVAAGFLQIPYASFGRGHHEDHS